VNQNGCLCDAWAHDYDPDRAFGATFQSLPGASFVVNGAARASDSVLTAASIECKWINNWSIAATFEGEFSDVTASLQGRGALRLVGVAGRVGALVPHGWALSNAAAAYRPPLRERPTVVPLCAGEISIR
jgi:hypothetical protein